MLQAPIRSTSDRTGAPPFLPLAFRFAASFGLIILHLSLPLVPETAQLGAEVYLLGLAIFFLEALWEGVRNQRLLGSPFATPELSWVRFNLVLDLALVAFVIAFQGVDQERFAALYIFPVLASAFYLSIPEIVGIGTLSTIVHIITLLGFTSGALPAFGLSGPGSGGDPALHAFALAFASLKIFGATLVVVLIRRSMEGLRRTLTESEAVVGDLSALYRRVVDSLFSGLITTDLEGRITSANPAAEIILKRSLQPGLPISSVLPADLGIESGQARERRFECTLVAADGAPSIIGGNVAPIRGAERGRTGFLLLFQDLTEIKELEERTRISERLAAVGELSAGLAHELRNPLASILGSVQILRQPGQSPAMLDRVLGILGRESERVSAILTDFLDYARPRPLKPQALWLPDLLKDLKESWDTDPRNRSVPLHLPPAPRTWISGEPLSFHQVFTNLLSNARKASEGLPGAAVHLHLAALEDHLDAVVADTGHGMTPDQLERIFVPFSSSFKEGTGLGMSLVYQYALRQGWTLKVQSSPETGTSVHVRIPLAQADSTESQLAATLPAEPEPLRSGGADRL